MLFAIAVCAVHTNLRRRIWARGEKLHDEMWKTCR
jgi:hypothetical protein